MESISKLETWAVMSAGGRILFIYRSAYMPKLTNAQVRHGWVAKKIIDFKIEGL